MNASVYDENLLNISYRNTLAMIPIIPGKCTCDL